MRSILIAIFLLPSLSFAGKVVRGKTKTQVFKNKNCYKTDSCDLKSFKVESYDYGSHFGPNDVNYGTGMYASFKTKTVDTLEKYSVVQFIKGCKFNSSIDENGNITRRISEKREFFGDIVDFIHKDWVIDSVDVDPVYNSHEQGRHLIYRWNPTQNTRANHIYVYKQYPTVPFLYVRDFPGTARAQGESAKNISLKFKTCLYKSADIPFQTGPKDVSLDDSLSCFEWSSSFIYNFKKKKYDKKKSIDPFCNEVIL